MTGTLLTSFLALIIGGFWTSFISQVGIDGFVNWFQAEPGSKVTASAMFDAAPRALTEPAPSEVQFALLAAFAPTPAMLISARGLLALGG